MKPTSSVRTLHIPLRTRVDGLLHRARDLVTVVEHWEEVGNMRRANEVRAELADVLIAEARRIRR